MKTKRLLGLLLLILSITGFFACSDVEPQDKVKTVKMLISDKTGTYQQEDQPKFFSQPIKHTHSLFRKRNQ